MATAFIHRGMDCICFNADPTTQLAILFSAIIHDVDNWGVSNMQLIKEEESMADKYCSKSVAEQDSLDISWSLLMSDPFNELRNALFATEQEIRRFRQVVVIAILATDIFDKELNDLRKERWNKAFSKTILTTTFIFEIKG
jgi:3'5'-cyclic nucleotide phosphodiesterase